MEKITEELIKKNITEEALLSMEESFPHLVIKGIDDKVGYKAVHDARISCRNTRNLVINICEEGRAELLKKQKEWIKVEKEIVSRIKKVEDGLAEKEKAVDDEKERIQKERELEKQKIMQDRTMQLVRLGASYTGSAYTLPDEREGLISVGIVELKNLDDFQWGGILAVFEARYEVLLVEKEEKEQKAVEEAKKAKELAVENERKSQELKRQQEELDARQKAITEAEERVRAMKEAEERTRKVAEEALVKKQAEERLKLRKSKLYALGFASQGDRLTFQEHTLSEQSLSEVSDDLWDDFLLATTKSVSDIKARLEKERVEREQSIKEEAARKERERIETETKAKAEKVLAEEKERARLADLQPNEVKLKEYLKTMSEVPLPSFSGVYEKFLPEIEASRKACLMGIWERRPS